MTGEGDAPLPKIPEIAQWQSAWNRPWADRRSVVRFHLSGPHDDHDHEMGDEVC